jgi:hypothetical protein
LMGAALEPPPKRYEPIDVQIHEPKPPTMSLGDFVSRFL